MPLPFDQLTRRGRARRLLQLARDVLVHQYGVTECHVRLLSMHSFNTVFRVDGADGVAALRIGDDCRIHPHGVEDVEARWLRELARNGFDVANVVPTTTGKNWTTHSISGVPGDRVCTLFTWVPGRELRSSPHTSDLRNVGRLLGELHRHAAGLAFDAPHNIAADQPVYFGTCDLVPTYESHYGSLFVDATARVEAALDELWQNPSHKPHLLHGDFGPHNIMVWRSRLFPIDFQDLRHGFAVQDVALTVADLSRRYPDAVPTFLAGYAELQPSFELAPSVAATFAAQRSLNIMNLGLQSPDSGLARVLGDHASRVVEWMNS